MSVSIMNVNFCNFQNFWQTNSIKKFINIIIIIISGSKKMMIIELQTSAAGVAFWLSQKFYKQSDERRK